MSPALAAALIFALAAPADTPADTPAEDGVPTYDIPRVADITIDGDPADWGDRGFRVEVLTPGEPPYDAVDDHHARFRLAWDAGGLLVLMHVYDDAADEHDDVAQAWQGDSVELFIADDRGGKAMVQVLVAPGLDEQRAELETRVNDHRKPDAMTDAEPRAEPRVKAARRPTGTERGFGTTWYKDEPLSGRTFGHGAASAATLRIDLENELVIAMNRNRAGTNHRVYHGKWIQAIVDAMAE